MPRPRRLPRERLVALAVLAVYGVALALVAFWPSHVDRDAGPLLRAIERLLPWATYDVVEFVSNVLLFVPLGAVLAFVLRRAPWATVAVGLGTSAVIELAQWMLLPGRTGSVLDVVANTLGTVVGCAAGLAVRAVLAARRGRRIPQPRR